MINLFDLKRPQLKALAEYKDVLETGRNFKRNFWQNDLNEENKVKANSHICSRYCLENLCGIEVEQLPQYNLKQIKEMLIQHRLFGMIQTVFKHDVLEILKNAYPKEFKQRILKEWMWSKHGLWHNDRFIIEAVQDMVLKEGIRRVEDIPKLDWKKRLLDHGIYNLLAYFNWSIYSMFNFVYPKRFHPSDFKYKIKWRTSKKESMANAFHFMHKTFKDKRLTVEEIMLLGTADFRRLGLAGMLMTMFDGSVLKAKEYYLYKTLENEENQNEIIEEKKRLEKVRQDEKILKRIKSVAVGKFIYNLNARQTVYDYLTRHANKNNMSLRDFIAQYGYVYKTAQDDHPVLDPQKIWDLRRQRYSYVQIAEMLGSNPTSISNLCDREFGGDPLIPRPIEDYITVQELMNEYHVDHKTVMKIVKESGFENHMSIRLRYLKRSEIIPALKKYKRSNKQHKAMVKRYAQ